MNVLILSNHLNYGGITAYVLNLSRVLHGQEGVKIFAASRGGDLEKEFSGLGIKHIRLPLTTKCEVSPKVFLSFLELRKAVRELQIDLIHANTRVTQVLASMVSSATKTPYLSTCHGYFKTRLSRRLFPCWGRKVIAISDQVRDHLICDFRLAPEKIELIYNGIDVKKFRTFSQKEVEKEKDRLGLAPGKKIIGHIGRLSSVKGQKFFVLAAEELVRKRKDLQFLIVGDGDQEHDLKALIRQKGLGDDVLIRSSVTQTALALSLMDVFVMPSLQEGLGISILEAQAQGVPVVASRVGGIPTIVEDGSTGLLVGRGDPGSLSTAIMRFLDDEAFRKSVVARAQAQVKEKFSIEEMAEKTRRLYKEILC